MLSKTIFEACSEVSAIKNYSENKAFLKFYHVFKGIGLISNCKLLFA